MTYGNSKRMSGAAGCYCSQLVDSTCDFCSGLRIGPDEELVPESHGPFGDYYVTRSKANRTAELRAALKALEVIQ